MTRRPTWTSFVSRIDRDTVSAFSSWLLVLTSVGSFTAFVALFGRQMCMVVFYLTLGTVAIFVLFVQPPEGALRRKALRNVLLGSNDPQDRDIEKNDPDSVVETKATGVRIVSHRESRSQLLCSATMPSVTTEKLDDVHRLRLSRNPGVVEVKKRGVFRHLLKILKKGRREANPFYTTLTEQVTPVKPAKQVRDDRPSSQLGNADRQLDGVKESREIRRAVVFQPEPSASSSRTGHTKSTRDLEITKQERGTSRSTGVPHAPSGLRPLKTAFTEIDSQQLGSRSRRSTISKSADFPFGPSSKHKAIRTHLIEDWGTVANSSYSASPCSENETSCLLVGLTKSDPIMSRRRSSDQFYSERKTMGQMYVLKDPKEGRRKVYHVWSV
ncbi:hypothetical protein IscW_ISCW008929 [Ixodes scapularis]|uniref:Uncharacterized protein n=1 Tax=Ixodes scapularis TaxID=6945 RepID=B7Q319_IXOSC|nr:hypothetical protein IscW_ISCW008929 [Ixodes scapularis]|eukprot:XP_002411117.1 hypothetical protein IscW_ISCW008929 [Ixodes scapularis]